MTNFERPRTPPETPPAIDPNVDPKTASKLEGNGETEGEVFGKRSEVGKINREMSDRMANRSNRDGAGEKRLDSMQAETTLPPD